MEISLTSFIDFVISTPGSKVRVVRDAKRLYEEGYEPARDYYGPLRRAIVKCHKTRRGTKALDSVIAEADAEKIDNYTACITGYRRFVGRKKVSWITEPPTLSWTTGDLTVSLNPELNVMMRNQAMLLKLYFKADALSKTRIDTMLHLLENAFGSNDRVVGILDVRRGRLIHPTRSVPNVDLLLDGEAASFARIWEGLKKRPAA